MAESFLPPLVKESDGGAPSFTTPPPPPPPLMDAPSSANDERVSDERVTVLSGMFAQLMENAGFVTNCTTKEK